MVQYKHVISLGWFCSVAEELEKIGLRTASYPFDWILTDWETVMEMMEGSFLGFLDADKLEQDEKTRNMYHHKERKCLTYVHDIDPYENYERQVEKARLKYERRLERLRRDICEPCIFVRYIRDAQEFQYITEHRRELENWLEGFHPENRIVYIANEELGQASFIWSVCRDENDGVARIFLDQLPELRNWLLAQSYDFSIEYNLKRYRKNHKRKKARKYLLKVRHGIRRLQACLLR